MVGASMEYRSFDMGNLTQRFWKRIWEHCLVGSLTGEVAC